MDFNKLMTEELNERRKGNMFKAFQPEEQPPGPPEVGHESSPPKGEPCDLIIHIDTETDLNEEYGPQQVQSLLGFVVDVPLDRALDGALDDADAVTHLNRFKKRWMTLSTYERPMVFTRPDMVDVQKKDLRRLYRLTDDLKGKNTPKADEAVLILRRILQLDRFDHYEPQD
jgi:hypothetical protein